MVLLNSKGYRKQNDPIDFDKLKDIARKINNMTPLEEKIDAVIKFLQENGWTVEEQCLVFDQLRYIAQQAVEEERKRILDELPEEKPTDWDADRLTENIQTVCNDGFNECLSKVRNIISKPNI